MQQYAVDVALADFAQSAPALFRRIEVDLAGVLNRQNMTAGDRRNCAFSPAFDDPLGCHLVIAEKAVEPHLDRAVSLGAVSLGETPQAYVLARDHASDKRRPPLSRRRSPNRPNVQSTRDNMAAPHPIRSATQGIT